jgi:hypothetical protein
MNSENIEPPLGGKGGENPGGEDRLEQFIRSNRDALDDLKAPQGLFDKIVPIDHKVSAIWKWMAVAASALLLISVGYIVGSKSQPETRVAGWNEFQEAEQYYQSKIDAKMEKIKTLPVSSEVMSDIQMLDEVYAQLRKQLLEDPNADSRVLLSAMIKHQKQKLEVMDEILNRVEKYKKNENDKRNEM